MLGANGSASRGPEAKDAAHHAQANLIHLVVSLFIVAAWALSAASAAAGEFRLVREQFSATRSEPLILLSGPIEKGDAERLAALIDEVCASRECDYQNTAAMLSLNSPGGSFTEGIALAETMREKQVASIVENGSLCLSACALAWLGGSSFHPTGGVGTYIDRYVEPDGQIGFHSPYLSDAAIAALPEEERLGTQATGLRLGISKMVRFLASFGVDPLVIDRIVAMGPDEVMTIETVADVVAFRGELPPVPVSTLGFDRRAITYNVCLKLLAHHNGTDLDAPSNLESSYGEAQTGKTRSGEAFLGFEISDRPLTIAFCGANASQAIPSDDFTISLARMAWKDDVSETYTEPFTNFVFSKVGWNQAAYDGQRATQSILRLTPMVSWLLPKQMRLADLPGPVRAAIEADKRGIAARPTPQLTRGPAATPPRTADFSRLRAAVISDAVPTIEDQSRRLYRFGDLDVEVTVGSFSLYSTEAARRDRLNQRLLTYNKHFDDSFVYSGVEADRQSGFYNFALLDGDATAVVRIGFALGADGRATQEAQRLIGQIACSARFGAAGLPCAKK
ncbi:COG3904 family protein [Jiella marina]|uniref:COG3904 family protein n=1 Tax=Jiella sp. LLJ827 TaxID=2917712 RepID=UPI0021012EEE|nr:hypothetical protein [Jiella sp. LLJ827]MCQ0989164.1 hypothetical protein [Jiella sp. LLJ827]